MFYSLPEEELRTICRVNIEAFEKWARTVIHSELTAHLGANYFDIELSPNVPVVKKSIRDKTAIMMRNHPQRFHRKIDTLFLEEIIYGFKELEEYLCTLPLDNNNAVFNLCCRLCSAYEHKAFLDGLQYGSHLIQELK